MSRFESSTNQTAAAQPHVPYVLLAEFDFASGFVRLSSRDRAYTHQSNTFGAIGNLGGVGPVRENGNLSPEKLEFQLSGVDTSLISTTLTEDYHGRDARLWVGYLGEDDELVATPQIIWEGFMDTMTLRREAGGAVIALVCENRLIRWKDTAGWLYTFEHQQLFDSTDTFFDKVSTLPNKVAKWGGATVYRGEGGGSSPRDLI